MASHAGRLYALALALVVFFLAWAALAAHPWAAATPDTRLKQLAAREGQLRRESVLVRTIVAQRWALYRTQLQARRAAIASAKARSAQAAVSVSSTSSPAVRVVTLPPITITRTS